MLKENNKAKKIAKTATQALQILWGRGFFKVKRKNGEIFSSLSELGYNFSSPELGMALMRAKFLTRFGKRGNFDYIQKYPFINEDEKD